MMVAEVEDQRLRVAVLGEPSADAGDLLGRPKKAVKRM